MSVGQQRQIDGVNQLTDWYCAWCQAKNIKYDKDYIMEQILQQFEKNPNWNIKREDWTMHFGYDYSIQPTRLSK